ncbi:MAG: hypothetical protein M1824_002356 [Vezdaea acicularis]|nr:MAG: hypothetical protein M1824_002356 [Vezdaea acicularis]
MAERLAFIENHPSEFPCRAIRRCWNVKTQPELHDNIVEDFRTAYPDCDKTDREIERALLLDIRTKNKILIQAAKEDGTVTKGIYRMENSHMRGSTIIRYPRFKDAAQPTGRHDDPLASIPEYTDYGDKLKVVEARRKHQVMTARTVGTPTPDYTIDNTGQVIQDNREPTAARTSSPSGFLPIEQSSSLSTGRPIAVPPAPSSSIGSEVMAEIIAETRRAPMAPSVYPDALQSPRSVTAPESSSRAYARAPASAYDPAQSSDPTQSSDSAQAWTSTALAAPAPSIDTIPLSSSPFWTRPNVQYPARTWQPSNGHGDPSSSDWLLFDPRDPLPKLDTRGYSAGDGRMMAFPVYVKLSDRAFGHVIVSTVSYRSKTKYWPFNFKKDACIVKDYVSKGAGYFFVDGRVGIVDTVKLLGDNYRGPIPNGWNLANGSARSTAHIHDLAPSNLGILDCYIPHTAMEALSRQIYRADGTGNIALPPIPLPVQQPITPRLSRQVYRADGTGNTALPPIPSPVQQSITPGPIDRNNSTTTARTTSGWTAINASSAQTGNISSPTTTSRQNQPENLQSKAAKPRPVRAPVGDNSLPSIQRTAAASRQASSPPKGSSKRLSKVSKKALFEESKWLREDLERYERQKDRQKQRLLEIESMLEPSMDDTPSVPNVRSQHGRPYPTPFSPARQAAPSHSAEPPVTRRKDRDTRQGQSARATDIADYQDPEAGHSHEEHDDPENDDANSIESDRYGRSPPRA